jgi:membrane protease YdiL (CAAX protease family)
MTRVAAAPRRKNRTAGEPRNIPKDYWTRSQLPLASLAFLIVPIIIYELGTRFTRQEIIAFNLLQDFFHLFGATGRSLPAMAVVGILLTWHIARNDPWRVDLKVLAFMAVESIAWAIPLMLIGKVLYDHLALSGFGTSCVLSIGAGIYEELVFRLIAFTALHFLLRDWLKIENTYAYLAMVLISAICFSLYHYLGPEQFHWRTFVFRAVAGIYFGGLFLWRGFGVTCGSHVIYDILIAAV